MRRALWGVIPRSLEVPMLFSRPLVAIVFAGLTGVSVYACSSDPEVTPGPATVDAGPDRSTRDVTPQPVDDGGDGAASTCKPGDVTGFTPVWKGPTAPSNK